MSSPISRDEALNLAAVISIVIACLISGTAIGLTLVRLVEKLL